MSRGVDLPIHRYRGEIIAALRESNRVILEAPTGSGKSTQVPQMLLESGVLKVNERAVILQPRRIAARMLAARVAHERDGKIGDEVGYQIRFEDRSSRATRLLFVTEGILLRQMTGDPTLGGVGAVIFDEFHERNLYSDICLALAIKLQRDLRPDLRVIVMSATLDTKQLETFLDPCKMIRCEGRTFPVDIEYLSRAPDDREPVWESAAAVLQQKYDPGSGSALVFMPGAYEIQRTIQAVRARLGGETMVVPLHGELPPEQQDVAVAGDGPPRVIVSTNVAETSLTIDGVTMVVDSGLARIARHDPYRGINTLLVENISRASADQRAGRAGRTAPGRCVRLWTARDHEGRVAHELPEVRRVDLSETLLSLAGAGIMDPGEFPWFERPDSAALEHAQELLADLGAIRGGTLTPVGRDMLKYPVHPRYGRMFVAAKQLGCERVAAVIAALTQGRGILTRAEGKDVRERREDILETGAVSDFDVQARAWQYAVKNNYDPGRCRALGVHGQASRQVSQMEAQFRRLLLGKDGGNDEGTAARPPAGSLQRCVLAGFADHVAARLDQGTLRCALTRNRKGVLARESVARDAPLIVVGEIREIDGRDGVQTLLSLAAAIEVEMLRDVFPDDVREERSAFFDAQLKRVVAREDIYFRDLIVVKGRLGEPREEESARVMAGEVLKGNVKLEAWDDAVDQWIIRVNCLNDWMPELQLPPIDESARMEMIAQICHGAENIRELNGRSVWPAVKGWLNSSQIAQVEKLAPERLELPGGRRVRIQYAPGQRPKVGARIQDLYGVEKSLAIAGGRVVLSIEVLAPNHRPVQVTDNLANFWRESYPRIKQDLQRRYPRHEWR
jgi:ATP-dependent helicase HrpB